MEQAFQDWINIGQVVVVPLCHKTLAILFGIKIQKVRMYLEIFSVIVISFLQDTGETTGMIFVDKVVDCSLCLFLNYDWITMKL